MGRAIDAETSIPQWDRSSGAGSTESFFGGSMKGILGVCAAASLIAAPAYGWDHWGGDSAGTRFSPLAQITPDNVTNLVPAWQFRTGDLDRRPADQMKRTKFEVTPLLESQCRCPARNRACL